MAPRDFAFAALVALSLTGCTTRTAPSDAPQAPATQAVVPPPVMPAPAPATAPSSPAKDAQDAQDARDAQDGQGGQDGQASLTPHAKAARTQDAPEASTGWDAANPSRSCRTDSDCAVKDVGNCCGYFPMCVNKDARTDPAAVRAQCAKDGMSSICGFQDVSGCRCVDSRCQNLTDGSSANRSGVVRDR